MTQPDTRPPGAPRKAPRIDVGSIQVAPTDASGPANEIGWSGPAAVSAATLKAKKPKIAVATLWLLLAVGFLNIGLGTYFWGDAERTIRSAFAGEVDNRQWQNMMNSYASTLFGIQIGAGAIWVVLAAASTRSPVFSAVLGVAVFGVMIVTFFAIEPESLLMGIIWKVIMAVALIAAVVTARTFEQDRKRLAPSAVDSVAGAAR